MLKNDVKLHNLRVRNKAVKGSSRQNSYVYDALHRITANARAAKTRPGKPWTGGIWDYQARWRQRGGVNSASGRLKREGEG